MKRHLILLATLVAIVGSITFYVTSMDSHRTLFVKRFLNRPSEVGALLPSSPKLAEAIVARLPPGEGRHLLEIGPGTGSFTELLVSLLGPHDRLDLVEIDPNFAATLRKSYAHDPRVRVHEMSILDWTPGYLYDGVVSGLPLSSFSPPHVALILEKYSSLLTSGGTLSYFEYVGLPEMRATCVPGLHKARESQRLKESFMALYGEKTQMVWLNIPPARVCHCKKP